MTHNISIDIVQIARLYRKSHQQLLATEQNLASLPIFFFEGNKS